MLVCLDAFFDETAGGFFDTDGDVLGTRLKRIEDVPHPSGNAAAVRVLLKLALITGREVYQRAAERTLAIFAGTVRELGAHAGTYFSGLDAFFRMIRLTVEAPPDGPLARAARAASGLACTVISYGEDRNRVIPCVGTACYEPVSDPDTLAQACMRIVGMRGLS
jgi:uncharacterized protein YyaL (SSP411 family)